VKEFVIYTVLRLVTFVAVFAVVLAIWILVAGPGASLLWPLVVAFLASGLISMFLLSRPREAFARRVQERAERAASKFEEMRTKED
jgi:hypothetical protein